jgi:hypothetical protein
MSPGGLVGEKGIAKSSGLLPHGVAISPVDSKVFDHEFVVGFLVVGVMRDAVHRADFDALRGVVMPNAFGAKIRVDDVDLITLRDGPVGAFGFANIAVDTFVGDK